MNCMPDTDSEVRSLEREIAEGTARSDIECHCLVDDDGWFDTAEEEGDLLAKSVRYLELREMILRHPDDPHLVRFR